MPLFTLDSRLRRLRPPAAARRRRAARSSRASVSRSSAGTAPASRRSCRSSRATCARRRAPSGGSPACAWPGSCRTCRSSRDRPVFDVVADGLGDLSELVTAYHHAARRRSPTTRRRRALERLGRLQHELEERDGWRLEQRVELVLDRLGLPRRRASVDTLSGGWRRRVLLARALVAQPDAAAARRADQPPRHRRDRPGSRRSSPTIAGARASSSPTTARSSQRAGDADRRARSRPADVVAGRLRDVPAQEGGVARERGGCSRRSSTRSWPRRKSGCARASRRGGRATRAACAR